MTKFISKKMLKAFFLIGVVLPLSMIACETASNVGEIELRGVFPIKIVPEFRISEAVWSFDARSLLVISHELGEASGLRSDLYLVNVSDTSATHLLESMKLFNARNPTFSPDGQDAMFAAEISPIGSGIHKLNLQTGELDLEFDASYAVWSNSGDHIALLNAKECNEVGPYRSSICILNANTGDRKIIYSTNRKFEFGGMVWSGDDKHLAISFSETDLDSAAPRRRRIYTFDLQADQYSPITLDSVDAYDPAWSLDNEHIVYVQNTGSSTDAHVMVMPPDGSCQVQLVPVKGLVGSPNWSPDGRWLSFVYNFQLYKIDLNDTEIKRVLTTCPSDT